MFTRHENRVFTDLCRKYTIFNLVLSSSDNEKQSQTKADKIKSALKYF